MTETDREFLTGLLQLLIAFTIPWVALFLATRNWGKRRG